MKFNPEDILNDKTVMPVEKPVKEKPVKEKPVKEKKEKPIKEKPVKEKKEKRIKEKPVEEETELPEEEGAQKRSKWINLVILFIILIGFVLFMVNVYYIFENARIESDKKPKIESTTEISQTTETTEETDLSAQIESLKKENEELKEELIEAENKASMMEQEFNNAKVYIETNKELEQKLKDSEAREEQLRKQLQENEQSK